MPRFLYNQPDTGLLTSAVSPLHIVPKSMAGDLIGYKVPDSPKELTVDTPERVSQPRSSVATIVAAALKSAFIIDAPVSIFEPSPQAQPNGRVLSCGCEETGAAPVNSFKAVRNGKKRRCRERAAARRRSRAKAGGLSYV